MFRAILAAALLAFATTTSALAAAPAASDREPTAAEIAELKKQIVTFDSGLTKRTGAITLDRPKVVLNLGKDYYWLDAKDARRVLVDGWGNPPQNAEDVYGMIFPAGAYTQAPGVWGAVITYEDTGYVSDKDAAKTDYDKLMAEMQKGQGEVNAEREKAGFQAVNVVGWAQKPVYDARRHSVIWARDLRFGGETEDTLNYDVRVLGRRGVLSMNIVSSMSQLDEVRPAGEALQHVASFASGSAYADYKPGVDKKAAYGIGGLVLAGAGLAVVKKAGIVAVLLVFLKKGFVLVLAAAGGAWGWIKRRLASRRKALDLGSKADAPDQESGGEGPWR